MTPDCSTCRGACCEEALVPLPATLSDVEIEFLEARGTIVTHQEHPYLRLESPCPHLQAGLCDIYDRRPLVCRGEPVGGTMCLDAIARRRP